MNTIEMHATEIREEGPCLPDDFIRRALGNPRTGPVAIVQASYSAALLEDDRAAVENEHQTLLARRAVLMAELESVNAKLAEMSGDVIHG